MFQAMMDAIKEESVGYLFNLKVEVEAVNQDPEAQAQAAATANALGAERGPGRRPGPPQLHAKGLEAPQPPGPPELHRPDGRRRGRRAPARGGVRLGLRGRRRGAGRGRGRDAAAAVVGEAEEALRRRRADVEGAPRQTELGRTADFPREVSRFAYPCDLLGPRWIPRERGTGEGWQVAPVRSVRAVGTAGIGVGTRWRRDNRPDFPGIAVWVDAVAEIEIDAEAFGLERVSERPAMTDRASGALETVSMRGRPSTARCGVRCRGAAVSRAQDCCCPSCEPVR